MILKHLKYLREKLGVGGTDDSSRELTAAECLDPSTWTWEALDLGLASGYEVYRGFMLWVYRSHARMANGGDTGLYIYTHRNNLLVYRVFIEGCL